MNFDTVKRIFLLFVSIIMISAIVYFGYRFIAYKVNEYKIAEGEFDKNEVLETFNNLIKEKYLEVYNETKDNSDKKLEDVYNVDVAISYLAEKGNIEYYFYTEKNEQNGEYTYIEDDKATIENGKRDDLYYINIEKIDKVQTYGKGVKYIDNKTINEKDVFVIQKEMQNDSFVYNLKYYDKNGNFDIVGSLELANPLKK